MAAPDLATLAAELAQREREHDELARTVDEHGRTLVKHEEQISGNGGLANAMEKLSGKVDSLNRALYTFALSFIVSALGIAIAIGFH